MKIGEFAEINKVSIDTIRHYMNLGLLLSEKQGGQYSFDAGCQKSLDDIIEFKGMGFTLGEIKLIFIYKSFGKLTPYQQDLYYKTFFMEKHQEIEEKLTELVQAKDRLENRIRRLSESTCREGKISGIGIKVLDIFKCLKCGGNLVVADGTISNNQIIDGKLKCRCGEEYAVRSGILMVGRPYEDSISKYDVNYISDYINLTDAAYLENLYKSLEWGRQKFRFHDSKGKVLLELGTGLGFFLRSIYEELPDDCLYIAVDHSIGRHKFLKGMLDSTGGTKNIIYICSDFLNIPIQDKCVDWLLDNSGTSNYSFEHEEFLLDLADRYVKEEASLFGAYILFKNFGNNSMIEKRYRKNFMLQNIRKRISDLKYRTVEEKTSDYLEKGGEHENYFVEGEKVYTYLLYGQRWG